MPPDAEPVFYYATFVDFFGKSRPRILKNNVILLSWLVL